MAFAANDLGHIAEHNRLLSTPLGTLPGGYAQVTANQGSIAGTVVDLTSLTVTVTVGTGRRILVLAQAWFASTVAGDVVQMAIREGATTLNAGQLPLPGTANTLYSLPVAAPLTPTAGSHTYKLSVIRAAGSGTVTMNAQATFPAFILVQDIGV